MTKLSTQDKRRELARVQLERDTPAEELGSWERRTHVLIHTGHIFEKLDVWSTPNLLHPPAEAHISYKWKQVAEIPPGWTPRQWIRALTEGIMPDGRSILAQGEQPAKTFWVLASWSPLSVDKAVR